MTDPAHAQTMLLSAAAAALTDTCILSVLSALDQSRPGRIPCARTPLRCCAPSRSRMHHAPGSTLRALPPHSATGSAPGRETAPFNKTFG